MPKQIALPPALPPRLIGRQAAAAYVCVSPNTFDTLVEQGLMPKPRSLGDEPKTRDVRELDRAADALPNQSGAA